MALHVINWLFSKTNSLGVWILFCALCLNLSGNSAEMIIFSSDSTKTDDILTPAEMGIRNTTRWAYFVPGAGQLFNHNYFKAACVWGGMAYGVKFLLDNTQDLKTTRSNLIDALNQGASFATVNTLTERESYDQRYRDLSWFMLFGIHGLSILEAHVSANLKTLDVGEDLSLRWGFIRFQNQNSPGLSLCCHPKPSKQHPPNILN